MPTGGCQVIVLRTDGAKRVEESTRRASGRLVVKDKDKRSSANTAWENERNFAQCLLRYFLLARRQMKMVKVRMIT